MSRHDANVTPAEQSVLEKLSRVVAVQLSESERLLAAELKAVGMATEIHTVDGKGYALTHHGYRTAKEA